MVSKLVRFSEIQFWHDPLAISGIIRREPPLFAALVEMSNFECITSQRYVHLRFPFLPIGPERLPAALSTSSAWCCSRVRACLTGRSSSPAPAAADSEDALADGARCRRRLKRCVRVI
jgi:hypothetical protein